MAFGVIPGHDDCPARQAVLAHRREELLAAERGAGAVSSVDVGDAPVPEGDEVFGSQGGADGVVDGDPVDTLDAATGNDRGDLRSQLLNLGGRKLGAEQGQAVDPVCQERLDGGALPVGVVEAGCQEELFGLAAQRRS